MNYMQSALHILEHVFGFSQFRPGQQAVVDAVMAGENALVVMPTGGGKSLCYQVPALAMPGMGVVISPLIALMDDQVRGLREAGVRAGALHSGLDFQQAQAMRNACEVGALDVLYVSPERLLNQAFTDWLLGLKLSVVAIDEAHCVSQWGHDFRADYLRLNEFVQRLQSTPVMALTATADARTREDIVQLLGIADAKRFITGFDRPNIQYRVVPKQKTREQLVKFIRQEFVEQCGIVYCRSRRATEELAEYLQSKGIEALAYHAGLPQEDRLKRQRQFTRSESMVMVATIAFGMGVDKPDVRFVVHVDMPFSVEAYYQETGRAGRDGAPATALLFYGGHDLVRAMQMISEKDAPEAVIRADQARVLKLAGICELVSCRRQALLSCFGEQSSACGNCDNCLTPAQSVDATESAQRALSLVYRTQQSYGVGYLVELLLGKNDELARQRGHRDLPIYGTGKALNEKQWRSLYRQLIAAGYLAVAPHGSLHLNETARDILRGDTRFHLRLETQSAKQSSRRAQMAPHTSERFEVLRKLRKELADEYDIASYMVFNDATLIEMAERLPTTYGQMLAINGVGDKKMDKYGQQFLACLRNLEAAAS